MSVDVAKPTGDNWSVPIFRTFVTPMGRRALKLETAFWRALETMAQKSNSKVSDLIREILDEQREEGINASRAVRSAVVQRLLAENESVAALVAPMAIVKLMQQAPVPSFALDRQKRLVRVNDDFVRYLRKIAASSATHDNALLAIDRPTDQLFAELQTGVIVECGMSIKLDNHERRTNARFVVPPAASDPILVGFILA